MEVKDASDQNTDRSNGTVKPGEAGMSKFREKLYTNLPKYVGGICFEKLKDDDEELFGENIKENKSNHYKMRNSLIIRRHFGPDIDSARYCQITSVSAL